MPTLNPGTIYELLTDTEEYLKGSRWEFVCGADNDVFCNGMQCEYFGDDEVLRSPNQVPLEYSEEMQYTRASCLVGESI